MAATWPSPVVVAPAAPSFYYRYDPQTVVLPDGTTLAAWYTYDGATAHVDDGLWVAEHPVGGGWGTPTKIVGGGMYGLGSPSARTGPSQPPSRRWSPASSSSMLSSGRPVPAGGHR